MAEAEGLQAGLAAWIRVPAHRASRPFELSPQGTARGQATPSCGPRWVDQAALPAARPPQGRGVASRGAWPLQSNRCQPGLRPSAPPTSARGRPCSYVLPCAWRHRAQKPREAGRGRQEAFCARSPPPFCCFAQGGLGARSPFFSAVSGAGDLLSRAVFFLRFPPNLVRGRSGGEAGGVVEEGWRAALRAAWGAGWAQSPDCGAEWGRVRVGGGILGTGPPRSGFLWRRGPRLRGGAVGGGGLLAQAELGTPARWVSSGWGGSAAWLFGLACPEALGACPDGNGDEPFLSPTPPPRLRGLPRGGRCGRGGGGLGCGCLLKALSAPGCLCTPEAETGRARRTLVVVKD